MIRRFAAAGALVAVLAGIPLLVGSSIDGRASAATPLGNVYVAGQADTIYLPDGVAVTLVGGTPPPEVSPSASTPPSPTPSPTPTPTPEPSPTPTATPTPSPSSTASPLPSTGADAWLATYFANANLSGAPAVSTSAPAVAFDWGNGSPATGIPADGFSSRFARTVAFAAGTYRFTIAHNDGARVRVDGALAYDRWADGLVSGATFDLALTAGDHAIVVEQYEGGGTARIGLAWAAVAPPTPTPVPTPTPTPGPGVVPFGSRPASANITLSGAACSGTPSSPFVIENRTFTGAPGVSAIRLTNCTNAVVRDVDFIDVSGGVYVAGGSNVSLETSRFRNIVGPAHNAAGQRTQNIANLIQYNGTNGGHVTGNKGKCGDTEDIVSVFSSSNVTVEHNHFEGTLVDAPGCLAWKSNSGSGIALCDGGGHDNVARDNVVLNPGQVGIFIAGGTRCAILDNTVVGQPRPLSNVGIYVANYSGGTCSGHTVGGNDVRWSKPGGTASAWYDGAGSCGFTLSPANSFAGAPATIDPAWRVTL